MKKKDISFQLYTAREFKPYEEILFFLSQNGIVNVELFEVEAFDECFELINKFNMTCLSTHIGFAYLKNTSKIINKLKKMNIKHAIVPAPNVAEGIDFKDNFNKSEEEWNEFGKELSSYVNVFNENGLSLGYHNHSFEFNKLPSGKMPIECILDHNQNLKFEIDIGWTVSANADPLIWIKKYSKKIIACHLKDFYSKNNNLLDHKEQSSIGEGFINWEKILLEIKKINCNLFILEHDDPKDYKNFVKKSINYLNSIN
tara:strand:- start:372 stop:1142 length:771 start_codon:yes stop_codon:yes gene_type:complete